MPTVNKKDSAPTPPANGETESAAIEPDVLHLSEADSALFLDTVKKAAPPNESLRAAASRLSEMESKKAK
jgi:uncharacterized protein (DUF1778 family)